MKVSLYVREHSTRKYRKAKSTEPAETVYVLRYGGTWETIDAENWNDARVAQLRKTTDLSPIVIPIGSIADIAVLERLH